MPLNFHDSLTKLERLSPEVLDRTTRRIRTDLGSVEWKMGICLLAMKRTGAFRKLGYSTLTDYAERALSLSGRKTGALLGAAEALEHLPLISRAFRRGEICWGKVRSLHGLATPETEKEWLKFASAHSTHEVASKVSLSPRNWKRHQALKAQLNGEPISEPEQVRRILSEDVSKKSTVSSHACSSEPEPSVAAEEKAQAKERDVNEPSRLDNKTPLEAERTAPPEPPKTIRIVFELTPDQFALYEQAESRVRARLGRRAPRAEVLQMMADEVLSSGTARARARHQVLVHTTEGSDEGWYETSRGILPVSPEILEEAKGRGEVLRTEVVTHTCDREEASETDERPAKAGPKKRIAIPSGVLRRLHARANHCCERCGVRGGRLDVHHTHAVSEGGGNDLELLRLLCPACHSLGHQPDYARKPHWRAAREKYQSALTASSALSSNSTSPSSRAQNRRYPLSMPVCTRRTPSTSRHC